MSRYFPKECEHIIKDNYYCVKCGTLCCNKVSIIIIYCFIKFEYS